MITVTHLDGETVIVNAGLIEFIESTPDTVISMATGKRFMVRESLTEVVDRVVAYQQRIGHPTIVPLPLDADDEDEETD